MLRCNFLAVLCVLYAECDFVFTRSASFAIKESRLIFSGLLDVENARGRKMTHFDRIVVVKQKSNSSKTK